MAILIDPPSWPAHGRLWSHLASDTDLEELHAFAAVVGIPARGFDGDHYDVPRERYAALVAAGAREVPTRELWGRLVASGLRFPHRKSDHAVARVRAVSMPGGRTCDVDLLASRRPVSETRVFGVAVFLFDIRGLVLVLRSRARPGWGVPGGWREAGETVAEAAIRELQEESGFGDRVSTTDLLPVGYERFRACSTPLSPADGRDLLQLFRAHLPGPDAAPPPAPLLDDTTDHRWVTPAEFRALAEEEFWWPLAEVVLATAAPGPG